MKVKNLLAVLFAAFLLTSVAAWAGVTTDYDHTVDFAHYKTYSWGKIQTANGLWDDRVKDAVASQLAAKGWSEVPSGGDVVVTARDAIHNQQQLNTFYDGFGGGRRFGGGMGMSTTSVDNIKVGTLLVELFDGQSKNLIWQASATDTLSSNPDKNEKSLDKNVQKMFVHLPTQPKK
ncbi:DUF4136 domain-containing protein [Edaphobacter sp. HDX4]|uniref:DUF4136 domain-containing protein n=1 Tax=Edaphobacter sp. HDX4 TaxID=2794064 RepID=UPI002FE577DD